MTGDMLDREELGYRLRRLRKRAKWDQGDLALVAFGSNDATRISRLENGKAKRPDVQTIRQLAEALETRLDVDAERIVGVLLRPPDDLFRPAELRGRDSDSQPTGTQPVPVLVGAYPDSSLLEKLPIQQDAA